MSARTINRSTLKRTGRIPIALGMLSGAALAYMLDPDTGRRRRAMARDRSMAVMRRGWRRLGRFMRYLGSEMYGIRQKAVHEPPWATTGNVYHDEPIGSERAA